MAITTNIETEIRGVMDTYWQSYLSGDLETWASYLHEGYRNIGTTEEEIWNSKKEIVAYSHSVLDQLKGLADFRDKGYDITAIGPYYMVHEYGNMYLKMEEGWFFYSRLRLSSLIEKTDGGWLILHQHGSYPDAHTEKGQTFGFDKLTRENDELREAVKRRTTELELKAQELEFALNELRTTQAQLIQSEKMASLGELTAGIAHEIQNPLNFVNNFSEVNRELLIELKEEAVKGNVDEVTAIANDVIANSEKINHHGKRADAIVKGMLQHSRSGGSQKEPTDINALTDEYLRLAYHGLRAKDKSFNAKLETAYDERTGQVNVIPQDIGRVVLNLVTNAFYAVNEKKRSATHDYEPALSVSTRNFNGKVEIKISDNGNGIPQDIIDKIFQPFFTTKPTGQGTGLGLSLAYDIITKGHGGSIAVKSKEKEGTEFIVHLPITHP